MHHSPLLNSSLSLAHGGEQYTHDGSADILAQLDAQPLEEWEKRVEEKESIKWSSARGWMNMGTIFILCGGIVAVFLGVPIVKEYNKKTAGANVSGYNLGGINATGQFASIGRDLIDPDTPSDAYTRTGFDGNQWNLVFSDEFELDGRTFFPGDDPYWEAVDLHYWGTNDYEWYDPRESRYNMLSTDINVLANLPACVRTAYRSHHDPRWQTRDHAIGNGQSQPQLYVWNATELEQALLFRFHVLRRCAGNVLRCQSQGVLTHIVFGYSEATTPWEQRNRWFLAGSLGIWQSRKTR